MSTSLRASSKLVLKNSTMSKAKQNAINMRTSLPRKELFPGNDIPAPGYYNTTQEKRIPLKSTISRSVERFPLTETYTLNSLFFPPGIGDNINEDTKMNVRWRKPIDTIEEEITPGPGDYNVKPEKDIGRTNYAHVIVQRKEEKIPMIPGPGAYDLTKEKRIAYSYTISQKNNSKKIEITPGPADYAKSNVKKNKKIMVGNTNINLRGIQNKDDAIRYIKNTPEIRRFVDEIMKLVLENKPADPLEFIANHFGGRKQFKPFGKDFECDLSILYD